MWAVFAAFVITATAGLTVAAGPAQAAVSDCPNPDTTSGMANICLFDEAPYNYNSGFFRRTADQVQSTVTGGIAGCMNINTYYWHDYNGTVGDHASSLVINSHPGIQAPNGMIIKLFEWVGCNESGRSFALGFSSAAKVTYIPYLSNIQNCGNCSFAQDNEGSNFDNTIQSIKVTVL